MQALSHLFRKELNPMTIYNKEQGNFTELFK